jgi:hypothetical protein
MKYQLGIGDEGEYGKIIVVYDDGEVRITSFSSSQALTYQFLDNKKSVDLVTLYQNDEMADQVVSYVVQAQLMQAIKAMT